MRPYNLAKATSPRDKVQRLEIIYIAIAAYLHDVATIPMDTQRLVEEIKQYIDPRWGIDDEDILWILEISPADYLLKKQGYLGRCEHSIDMKDIGRLRCKKLKGHSDTHYFDASDREELCGMEVEYSHGLTNPCVLPKGHAPPCQTHDGTKG